MSDLARLEDELKRFVKGDVVTDDASREFYSHDASLFELKPQIIVYPKNSDDVCALVNFVNEQRSDNPQLSLTGRSGGTDMSGGAINDSIVVAYERYFTGIGEVTDDSVEVQPGVYYREFEPRTLAKGLLFPSYPASRDLCMMGGIVANDAGGEKSLVYGKTHDYIKEVKIVLRDGQEHTFRPLDKQQLELKLQEEGIEGDIYRNIHKLVTENAEQYPKISSRR